MRVVGQRRRQSTTSSVSARLERLLDEAPVRRGEPDPLQAEVAHVRGHEPVVAGIVHMVELDVGVALEQGARRLPGPVRDRPHVVGVRPPADGKEVRLR